MEQMMSAGLKLLAFFLVAAICPAGVAAEVSLEVKLPIGTRVKGAIATCAELKLETPGTVAANTVRFAKLLPLTKYDVIVTLEDGTILRGVDMGWYLTEKGPKQADPLDDEDKAALRELFDGIKGFENKRNMLLMNGNQERVTVLAELIRDTAFHSADGGEVIWRIELWYFKNQHGGWEKVQQQNQVLYRERFKNRQAYESHVKRFRYVPELGGLRFSRDESSRVIEVDPGRKSPMADVPAPATRPE